MKLKQIAIAVGTALSDRLFDQAVRLGLVACVVPLELEKEAHGKLPKEQQGMYVEKDGKFRLDVEMEDTSGLKSALEKEREGRRKEAKEYKEFMKRYDGIDPEKVKGLMAHFENAEEAELLKQGGDGIQKIVEKRVGKAREQHAKELEKLQESLDGAMEVASTYMDQVLDSRVMATAMKMNVHPSAIDDVLLRARQIFDIDDDGKVVQFDEDGESVMVGKDGKTPYTLEEWMESMKDKAPHWFPSGNVGGGAHGNRDPNLAGKRTMKRAAFEQLDQVDRKKFMDEKGVVID